MISVCVPTLIAYDQCINLILSLEKGTIKPKDYYILDNGGGFKQFYRQSNLALSNLNIIDPEKNIGVAGAWNWFLNNLNGDLLIVNDDIEFSHFALENFLFLKEKNKRQDIVIYTLVRKEAENPLPNFSLFLLNSTVKDKVGLFDEKFYPAYFEDNDYIYRLKLLNYNIAMFPVHNYYTHNHSATSKRQKELNIKVDYDYYFRKNKEYYIKKWGGEPRQEQYILPFNGEDNG